MDWADGVLLHPGTQWETRQGYTIISLLDCWAYTTWGKHTDAGLSVSHKHTGGIHSCKHRFQWPFRLSTRASVTVYPKKYAHGFCFAVLCCGYTLTDFPISIRLTSLALWQSNDCPSASKATLMNMDKCFMWIHFWRLHNHNKAKHNKTVCIFLGIYCIVLTQRQ